MADYRASVAGESFRNADGSSRQDEIARSKVGESVRLEREPDNPHDANCVRVLSVRGVQIGNLSREAASWVAERLDNGRFVSAEIESIGTGDGGMLGVVLAVTTRPDTKSSPAASENAADDAGKAKAKQTWQGCLALIGIVVFLLVLISMCSGPSKEDQAAATEASAEDKRKGFHCLNGWDGSSASLVKQVKEALREPSSFEHVETRITPVNDKGAHMVMMTYRARNGFGGMNVEKAIGTIDHESCEATLALAGS